jgi:hypothetical protein
MRIHPVAISSAVNVMENMTDRVADNGISLPWVGAMVAAAGDGDHVEIGSLNGASAITAALVKKELGYSGKVYCIDPYEPRDEKIGGSEGPMPPDILNGSPEKLKKNADAFGVELTLIQKKSQPWPKELDKINFVSAFIDGEHIYDTPWLDFKECAARTSGYISLDNYEEGYPSVIEAVNKALSEMGREWSTRQWTQTNLHCASTQRRG